ncbi:MAG: hypothetical protein ACYS8L_03075 [Planctomycetota bacterium]|jgi:Flp pilus assembly protein CpaB
MVATALIVAGAALLAVGVLGLVLRALKPARNRAAKADAGGTDKGC